jgi:hypothetical protein
MIAPRIWRTAASTSPVWFTPEVGCAWFKISLTAAGGGGCGSQNSNNQSPNLYGGRGGDSYFHLRPGVQAMFALAPVGVTVYFGSPHGLVADQAIFLENIPPGVGLSSSIPYFPINLTAMTCQLSATPNSPPFGGQSPIIATPLGENHTITVQVTWYGVQGGGSGGQIGDQGTPLGYWGMDGIGPDGSVQSWGKQGGAGGAGYRTGGPGGNGRWGGAGTEAYQDFGIAGTNLTGAGGGGAAPSITPSLFDFGGTGGAAGAFGDIFMTHTPGQSYFCWAGVGGVGGPMGTYGYPGGAGGHGEVLIEQHF